jgi:hypothetical protein
MSDANKLKNPSPLVKSVLALDTHFSDLQRLSAKINEIELKSDFDYEQIQRLINHFTECGQNVSGEVLNLSTQLNEARNQAEAAAQIVSARAEQLQVRKAQEQQKMESFRLLGEKVRELTFSLQGLKPSETATGSDEDRAKLSMGLSEIEVKLHPLIEEAQQLKQEAKNSKMRVLEQSADALGQSLQAVSQKLSTYHQNNSSPLQ